MLRRCAACCVLLGLASIAQAQSSLIVVASSDEGHARTWSERIGPELGETASLAEWARRATPVDSVDPARLAALSEIEALLLRARALSARFAQREGLQALRLLAQADELAQQSLDVPGAAAWYAEVQLATAIVATQVGHLGLAQASLRRAASVDPGRAVLLGEAHPDVVSRARAAIASAITGPRGRFEVRTSAAGAVAFLDDHALGSLPLRTDASVGPHVLRIEAPGYLPWARIVEVLEGNREPMSVELSPSPWIARAEHVEAAARAGDRRELRTLLRDWSGLTVWLLWASGRGRAVVVPCRAAGCAEAYLLDQASARIANAESAEPHVALSWMSEIEHHIVRSTPWWEEWWFWTAVGSVLALGAVGIGLAAWDQHPLIIIHPP